MIPVRNTHTAPLHLFVLLAATGALAQVPVNPGDVTPGEVDETDPVVAAWLDAKMLRRADEPGPDAPTAERMPTREELERLMRDVDATLADARQQVERARAQATHEHEQVEALRRENTTLRVGLGEQGGTIERLEAELRERDRQIADLNADLAAATAPDSGGPASSGEPIDAPASEGGPFHVGGEGPISTPAKPARARRSG